MARGRPPLDAETKASRRKAALHRYTTKYGWTIPWRLSLSTTQERREVASGCPNSDEISRRSIEGVSIKATLGPGGRRSAGSRASLCRQIQGKKPGQDSGHSSSASGYVRTGSYLAAHGADVLDERQERRRSAKTQQRHQGRLPPAPPPLRRQRRSDAEEDLTANQKRCRALRQCGFEEDNREDSDADLPPGMCGCELTECQRSHKNETQDRRDWKIFHIKYAKELQGTV
ncbi:hypothetical protein DFH06DRAFT_1145824 [Mycena polygramma]|nr:hypothetical protein DFH06DRAFT_1145824 [Mycena polygramma]